MQSIFEKNKHIMAKQCQITGKRVITGNNVSHAHNKTRRKFKPNLFDKKLYWAEKDKWITLQVSAAGIRNINKNGLDACLKQAKAKGYYK